jgi:hypothetical protein
MATSSTTQPVSSSGNLEAFGLQQAFERAAKLRFVVDQENLAAVGHFAPTGSGRQT